MSSHNHAQLAASYYADLKGKKKRRRAKGDPLLDGGLTFKEIISNMPSRATDNLAGSRSGESESFAKISEVGPLDSSIDFSKVATEVKKGGERKTKEILGDPSRVDAAAPAPPLPDVDFDSKWTHGKKGAGVKQGKKKCAHGHGDTSITTVPHKGEAATFKSLTLEQIRRDNFRLNHNIIIDPEDEIDLENTSCESDPSSDDEADDDNDDKPGASRSVGTGGGGNDDDDDEFSVDSIRRRHAKTHADNDDDADDEKTEELEREFDNDPVAKSSSIRKRLKEKYFLKKTKRKRGAVDRVAGAMGRFRKCFLCAWGKRTYDVQEVQMNKLMRIWHENIGEIPPEYIALAMHEYYKSVIKPDSEARGDCLPVWRSKDVFICITTHNHMPEMELASDLTDLKISQGLLKRKLSERGPDVEDKVRRDMMKEHRETMALKWRLYALPLERMNFHRSDRDVKLGGDRQYFRGLDLKKIDARAGAALQITWKNQK